LDETNAAHTEVLNHIKRRFREETFTRESRLGDNDDDTRRIGTIVPYELERVEEDEDQLARQEQKDNDDDKEDRWRRRARSA